MIKTLRLLDVLVAASLGLVGFLNGCAIQDVGNLSFDKDDQLAVEFVTAAANIRAESFGIPMHSLFESKGIAGNIVHAVATTNAIIAGLIVIEAIKVLQNEAHNYRYVEFLHIAMGFHFMFCFDLSYCGLQMFY